MTFQDFCVSIAAGALGELHIWHHMGLVWKVVCVHGGAAGAGFVRFVVKVRNGG